MKALRAAWARVLGAFTRDRYADELREELEFHLEMETQANIRRGMDPREARRRALIAAGGTTQAAEAVRARRGLPWLDALAADLRFGLRTLRNNPGFTAVVVGTLGLGIGANTAIFSVVDGILFRPLSFSEPERLVRVGSDTRGEFLEMRRELDVFEGMGLHHVGGPVSLTGDGEPVRVESAEVSAGFFGLLGVPPVLGRDFVDEEMLEGQDRVVILGNGLWRDRYGRDEDIIGRTLRVDGTSRTVVGVMPPDLPSLDGEPQLWLPTVLQGEDVYHLADMWSFGGYDAIARLGPGIGLEQARAAVASLAPWMRSRFPWSEGRDMSAYWSDVSVTPLQAGIVGESRPMLLVLLGAVGLVLLVACVNVANLLLARGLARRREIAVRTSLGAGRGRVARQLLTESLLLAAAGGAAGVVVAMVTLPALELALPPDLPRLDEVGIDLRILGFSLGATLATGLLFGIGPAWLASRADIRAVLNNGGSADGPGGGRISAALVSGQVALAVVLVISAGLLVRSLWGQLHVDPGFSSRGVVTATVAPPAFRYPDDRAARDFYAGLLERLERRPDVRSVAVASGIPFGGDAQPYQTIFRIEERDQGDENYFFTTFIGTVSPAFFSTLDIELQEGRLFTARDGTDDVPVAVVSRRTAEENWPGEDILGKRFRFIRETTWRTVVGVVEDVAWSDLTEGPGSSIYVPLSQGRSGVMQVVATVDGDPRPLEADLRGEVAALDPDTPVSDIRTMEARISGSVAGPRSTVFLVGLFAALALGLGALGIYGVVAYAVGRRTHEFGIRRALGARSGELMALVLRRGIVLAGGGIVLGVVAAVPSTRILSSLLYGVTATDPLTYAVVPVLLALVAAAASWIPARRATRVPPRDALRDG